MNIGTTERWIRVVVGALLLSLVWVVEGSQRWWGLVGLVPLVTGLVGFCPLYAMLGISTRPGRPTIT